ncbi:kiSS-1 receptor-like [Patiria miniata]|uniref:G-protein coupled receptors family 1 profile domain-containing protein n=1 Tax=Patiria miniata TaxID=46514 RepID=A0A914B6C7_PATMI|nr:kiSS-1 receptor-like [Patiria miniata]
MGDMENTTLGTTVITPLNVTEGQSQGGDGYGDDGLFKTLLPYQTVLAYLLIFVAGLGLVLNGMVLYIVIRHRDMHRVTNFFFANLALTDLLLLMLHASTSSAEMLGYYLAVKLGCSTVQYTRYVVAQVTCLTLALMSFDRYRVVAHPLSALDKKRRMRLMLVSILAIWIISFALHLPVAIFSVNSFGVTCSIIFPWKYGPKVFFTYTVVVLYVLPLAVATMCYILIWLHLRKQPSLTASVGGSERDLRRRRMQSTLRIIVLVVVMFALGWFGEHLFILLIVWDPQINFWSDSYRIGAATAKLMIYLNSMLNPFVYPFAGTGFKRHLPSSVCCRKGRPDHTGTSSGPSYDQSRVTSLADTHKQKQVVGIDNHRPCPQAQNVEVLVNSQDQNTWL